MTKTHRWATISAASLVMVLAGACQSATVDKFPDPGQILVHVNDEHPSPVPGVTVDLVLPDGSLVWRSAVTDASGNASPGAADGGVLPGNYIVKITPPSGYHFSASFNNAVPITIQSNKQVILTMQILSGP